MKEHDAISTRRFRQSKMSARTDKRTIKILPERLYEAGIVHANKMVQKKPSSYRRLGEEYYAFETEAEVFFGESIWGKQLYDFLESQGIDHHPVKVKFMRAKREGKRYYVCLVEVVNGSRSE